MTIKRLKEKLENPFALIAQGFVAGMVLFWVTAPEPGIAQVPAAPHAAETIIGG